LAARIEAACQHLALVLPNSNETSVREGRDAWLALIARRK
jgi:hypothetical protein